MLPISFHPDVKREIKDSFSWYQEQSLGLGHEFNQELNGAVDSIVDWNSNAAALCYYAATSLPVAHHHDHSMTKLKLRHQLSGLFNSGDLIINQRLAVFDTARDLAIFGMAIVNVRQRARTREIKEVKWQTN